MVINGGLITSEGTSVVNGRTNDVPTEFAINGGQFNDDAGNNQGRFTLPTNKSLMKLNGDEYYELKDVVAKVGNTSYASLADAVAAAENGDTVLMVADVTTSETTTVNKNLVLDLDGHTISADLPYNMQVYPSAINVREGATLQIENSSEEDGGAIKETCNSATVAYGCGILVKRTLRLVSGAVEGAGIGIRFEGAELLVDGGSVSGKAAGISMAHTSTGATAVINNGTIMFVDEDSSVNRFQSDGGSFTINGGQFSDDAGNSDEYTRPEGQALVKAAGEKYYTLQDAVSVTFDADNAEDDSDTWTVYVKKGAAVAKPEDPANGTLGLLGWFQEGSETAFDFSTTLTEDITLKAHWGEAVAYNVQKDKYYATMGAVSSDASNDGTQTIQLVADVNYTGDGYLAIGNRNYTLDLNGHTMSSERGERDRGTIWVYGGDQKATLTITDSSETKTGKIVQTAATGNGIYVQGHLILEGGSVESQSVGIRFGGRELTVNGGAVSGASAGIHWAEFATGVVTINNGTITSGSVGESIHVGTGSKVSINGGRFSDDVGNNASLFTLPEGMKLKKSEGEEYYTLQSAYADFGYSITLSDSIDITVNVKNLTQDPADYQIAYTFKNETTEAALTSPTLNAFVVASCSAKEMIEPVEVEVSYQNQVIKRATLSIQSYCDSAISKYGSSQDDKERALADLCGATLDYGSYAQKALDYKTGDLANGGRDNFANAGIQVPESAPYVSGECDGIAGRTLSLMTTSKTQLVLYFKHEKGLGMDGYAFTVDGQPVGAADANNKFAVTVEGISAKDLDKRYDIAVADGDGYSMTVNVGPLDYVSMAVAKGGQPEVSCALYNYHLKAKAYLG